MPQLNRAREIEREISNFERLRGGDTTKPQTNNSNLKTNIRMVEASKHLQKTGKLTVCQLCSKKAILLVFVTRNRSNLCCVHASSVMNTADKCPPLAVATQRERSKACQR